MTFGVKMSVKNLFFDRAHVVREVGKLNAKALSKAGAFVRRRGRSLIGQPSKAPPRAAGKPPRARSSDDVRSLRNILFAYEPSRQSVVIGPVRLNGAGGSVPAKQEFGGSAQVRVVNVQGQWRVTRHGHVLMDKNKWVPLKDIKGGRFRPMKTVTAKIPARPFMGPALALEARKVPSLYAMGPARAAA